MFLIIKDKLHFVAAIHTGPENPPLHSNVPGRPCDEDPSTNKDTVVHAKAIRVPHGEGVVHSIHIETDLLRTMHL